MEIILLVILLAAYCAPTIVAQQRRHKDLYGIAALNILLGWTFLGWVIALIWALKNQD